ncbi:MAG: exodeoxyribonuclease VII small subunit [Kiritimatiellia bacterium]|nr:exodeoxyribonuclease VII small subunit [Kiritimatiellia bacterium]
MTKKTDRNPSFEKALSELEAIVEAMESGSLPLEKMMEQYEQGMNLISFCSAKLNEVEKKIEIMVKKGDKVVPEPFDPEKAAPAEDVKQE